MSGLSGGVLRHTHQIPQRFSAVHWKIELSVRATDACEPLASHRSIFTSTENVCDNARTISFVSFSHASMILRRSG